MSTRNTEDLVNENIPSYVKILVYFIKQVGFPIVAFLLMFYMSFVTLDKATKAIEANTKTMQELLISTSSFQQQVSKDHQRAEQKLDTVLLKGS